MVSTETPPHRSRDLTPPLTRDIPPFVNFKMVLHLGLHKKQGYLDVFENSLKIV